MAEPYLPAHGARGTGRTRPRGERIITALDVGTSKVAAIVATVRGNEPPTVIGAGIRASTGLKRGLVADMDETSDAIRAAIMQAEHAAGIQTESVLVNIGAADLSSDLETVDIGISGSQIVDADVERLLGAGYQHIMDGLAEHSRTRTLLHAQPTLYTVDDLNGVTNPRGFYADKLAVDIHVMTAVTAPCRNLDLAVRNAHLDVEAIVASGLASSAGVLNSEERELGVALVEIGAGLTTIALHISGILAGISTIPIGAADITADLAASLGTPRTAAERLKTLKGAATTSPSDNHEMLDIPLLDEDDGQEPRRVSRADFIGIIRKRLDILFREVEKRLRHMGFQGPHGNQIVLTGGGAELRGIADFAQGSLNRNVRTGRPRGLLGLPDAQATAAFSTVAGLVLYAAESHIDLARLAPGGGKNLRARSTNPFTRLFKSLRSQI